MKFTELYPGAYLPAPEQDYPCYHVLFNVSRQERPYPRVEYGMRIEKGKYYSYNGRDFEALGNFTVDEHTHPSKFRRWSHVVLEE